MEKITDNKQIKWLAGVLAGLLGITSVVMGVYMTFLVMGRVLPNNLFAQIMSLAFFDFGALGWSGVYVYHARGSNQRSISLWMLVYDLLGVVAMVIGEILLGGQELVTIPAWLGKFIVDTVIVTFALNLIAWYYYHTNRPEVREAIQAQELEDELTEQAEIQARATIEREARTLGALLAGRTTARIKYRMRLPMTEEEVAEWRGETIDAPAEDRPALFAPISDHAGPWTTLKSFFGRGQKPQPPEPITTSPNTPNSNDELQSPAESPQA